MLAREGTAGAHDIPGVTEEKGFLAAPNPKRSRLRIGPSSCGFRAWSSQEQTLGVLGAVDRLSAGNSKATGPMSA